MKDRMNKCGVVVLTYYMWMSQKNKDIFSMADLHCEGLEPGLFHICMPVTTVIDGQILVNAMNGMMKILV